MVIITGVLRLVPGIAVVLIFSVLPIILLRILVLLLLVIVVVLASKQREDLLSTYRASGVFLQPRCDTAATKDMDALACELHR